jgi:penicillin G amidase
MFCIFARLLQHAAQPVLLLALVVGTLGVAAASPRDTLRTPYGPVRITRNDVGVPSISARGEAGAQFGLGYAHAQDRLWQMEWQRRLASGRTAEFLGADGLQFDVLFRTIGLRRSAEAVWTRLRPSDRRPLEAYVAGVNAYLALGQPLPPEFAILQVQPEPWTPVDVLAFGKLFTWGNGSNWNKELLRAQLAAALSPERAAQLTPAYLPDGPFILPGDGAGEGDTAQEHPEAALTPAVAAAYADLLALQAEVAARTGIGADGRGSNAWVLSGQRTTTGKPLLANDPHLTAQAPAIWYLAQLSFGRHEVIGATIPGVPGVQIGRNEWIAWGLATLNVDSQDLYIEQVNERGEALFQGTWEPLTIVPETITVKGAPDRVLSVRSSRHGPLLSDAVNPAGPTLAVRWSGHDPEDAGVLVTLAVNRARDWQAFKRALRSYRSADMSYVYADRAGNIGYLAAGTIPLRPRGDGSFPVPGWTGEHEWQGYVPFARLPHSFNPPEGFIVAANNRVVGGAEPYPIGNSYAVPYRAGRIVELIAGQERHSPTDMEAMQHDVLAAHARRLMPLLLRTTPGDERGRQALELLRGWDFQTTGDSAAAAVFEAWYIRIAERLFADELGALWPAYGRELYFVGMATETALREEQPWCDNSATPITENCADTLETALDAGLADMAAAQGSDDLRAWRWDTVHRAQLLHQPLGGSPTAGPTFNRSVPGDGDRFTVKSASSFQGWEAYDQRHGAQYRQVVSLGNLEESRWIVGPGQSGLPASPHYDDLLARWQSGGYLPMRAGDDRE